jgi:histidinol-phosphatase (PHP family)
VKWHGVGRDGAAGTGRGGTTGTARGGTGPGRAGRRGRGGGRGAGRDDGHGGGAAGAGRGGRLGGWAGNGYAGGGWIWAHDTLESVLPPDNHVHTEWSWDTPGDASMSRSCEQALAAGVPAVAFTDHLDFTDWIDGDRIGTENLDPHRYRHMYLLDVSGYLEAVADCRERYPDLRILSGVEIGEAHMWGASASAVVAAGEFDRVLGSLHAIPMDGRLTAADELFTRMSPDDVMRRYLGELVRLVEGSDLFQVLAHLDFPRRMWPWSAGAYDERTFETEYRAVLRALAASDRVLEVNTKSPLVSTELLGWWREAGGRAVSFGSDAHQPWRVGDKFKLAVDVVEAAGFRAGRDRFDFWRI